MSVVPRFEGESAKLKAESPMKTILYTLRTEKITKQKCTPLDLLSINNNASTKALEFLTSPANFRCNSNPPRKNSLSVASISISTDQ